MDHVIPLSDPLGGELVYEELNLRVLCRTHNAERGGRCTETERARVLDAISARARRITC